MYCHWTVYFKMANCVMWFKPQFRKSKLRYIDKIDPPQNSYLLQNHCYHVQMLFKWWRFSDENALQVELLPYMHSENQCYVLTSVLKCLTNIKRILLWHTFVNNLKEKYKWTLKHLFLYDRTEFHPNQLLHVQQTQIFYQHSFTKLNQSSTVNW